MENFGMNRRTSICSLIAIAAGGLFPQWDAPRETPCPPSRRIAIPVVAAVRNGLA